MLGRFSRLLELGRGGMARVWLCVASGPTDFRRLVAIKELSPDLAAEARFVDMFLEEARLAANLIHGNVVQTLEVVESGERPAIVMEYLSGQSLLSTLAKRRPPTSLHLRVLADVCAGLSYAHAARDLAGNPLSIVHRDICPNNVLISYDGQVKVADFGLAKARDSRSRLQAETRQGKLPYMAPERMAGGKVDQRADLFSVGVLLWEALRGRPRSGAEVMVGLRTGVLPDLPPTVEPRLVELVERAVHPDPRRRFGNLGQLREELENILDAHPVPTGRRDIAAFLTGAFELERAVRERAIEEKMRELEPHKRPSSASTGPPPQRLQSGPPRTGEVVSGSSRPASFSPGSAPPSSPERTPASDRPTARPHPSSAALEAYPPAQSRPPRSVSPRTSRPPLPAPAGYRLVGRLPGNQQLYQATHEASGGMRVLQFPEGVRDTQELRRRYGPAAALRSPATVRVLDAGFLDDGTAFVARPLVEGVSLERLLRRGAPLGATRVCAWMLQLLRSLAEAHDRGLLHGRLDPNQILIGPPQATRAQHATGETLSVLGFWPATVLRAVPRHEFVAPELRRGDGLATRPTADVYSVGALLHRCLLGRAAQPLSDSQAAETVVGDELDPTLCAVVARTLCRDPQHRFQSALDLLEALLRWDFPAGETQQPVCMRERYLLGLRANSPRFDFEPHHNELMSTRPVSVWVLDEGDLLTIPEVQLCISVLARRYEVRELGPAERALAVEELRTGSAQPPWVIVFGASSVLSPDPLLSLLSSCAEMTRVLIGAEADVSLLRRCISSAGLDHFAQVPSAPERILEGIECALSRTRKLSQHYDRIRLELARGRDRVGMSSRELTAL